MAKKTKKELEQEKENEEEQEETQEEEEETEPYKGVHTNLKTLEKEIEEEQEKRKEILGLKEEEEEEKGSDEEEQEDKEKPSKKKEEKEEPETAEEASWKKRYGDLRSYHAEQTKELKSQLESTQEELEKLRKDKIIAKLPATEEEVKKFKKEYPQVYNIIETAAMKKQLDVDQAVRQKLEDLSKKEERFKQQQSRFLLQQTHPDLDEINKSPEFKKWVEDQDDWVSDILFESNDYSKAARLIDLFKKETNWKQDKEQPSKKKNIEEEEAATSVKAKQTPTPEMPKKEKIIKESDVEKMDDETFIKMSKEISKARREGRFVYDISQPQ